MIMIKKRKGHSEPFDPQKIKSSLSSTSDEIGCPLNGSDLEYITGIITEMLEERDSISSRHIYLMILGILYDRRLNSLLDAYSSYVNNAWR